MFNYIYYIIKLTYFSGKDLFNTVEDTKKLPTIWNKWSWLRATEASRIDILTHLLHSTYALAKHRYRPFEFSF